MGNWLRKPHIMQDGLKISTIIFFLFTNILHKCAEIMLKCEFYESIENEAGGSASY
jgi:hypothetical protein